MNCWGWVLSSVCKTLPFSVHICMHSVPCCKHGWGNPWSFLPLFLSDQPYWRGGIQHAHCCPELFLKLYFFPAKFWTSVVYFVFETGCPELASTSPTLLLSLERIRQYLHTQPSQQFHISHHTVPTPFYVCFYYLEQFSNLNVFWSYSFNAKSPSRLSPSPPNQLQRLSQNKKT